MCENLMDLLRIHSWILWNIFRKSAEQGNQSLWRQQHGEKFIQNHYPTGKCNDNNDSDNDNDTHIIMSCCTLTLKLPKYSPHICSVK